MGLFDFQGLVFEEERPPPPNRAPLAPMLEFVSAQTGLPVVAVGGGSSLGREPQVREFLDGGLAHGWVRELSRTRGTKGGRNVQFQTYVPQHLVMLPWETALKRPPARTSLVKSNERRR